MGSSARPPRGPLLGAAAAGLVSLALFWGVPGIGPTAANVVGFTLGSVLGVVLLGWFSWVDNPRRANPAYSDWTVRARRAMRSVALVAWMLGLGHAWFLALEITRHL